jgi:hypothetical protein
MITPVKYGRAQVGAMRQAWSGLISVGEITDRLDSLWYEAIPGDLGAINEHE